MLVPPFPPMPESCKPLNRFRIIKRFAWIPALLSLKCVSEGTTMCADRWVWLRNYYYVEELCVVGWHSDERVYGWERYASKEYLKHDEADAYLRKSKRLILHKGVYREP